jgi:hypothetical protein
MPYANLVEVVALSGWLFVGIISTSISLSLSDIKPSGTSMSQTSQPRIYERDTDALFLRLLRDCPDVGATLAELTTARRPTGTFEVKGQVRHAAGTGSIDIVVRYPDGPMLLIENKIDAAYSITREGHGQPQRYRKSVAAFRSAGVDAHSVLLAPASYLASGRLADLFDGRVAYESLRKLTEGEDRGLLEAAIFAGTSAI